MPSRDFEKLIQTGYKLTDNADAIVEETLGKLYKQVKAVNPSNLLQTAGGEFAVMAKNTVKW